MRAIELCVITAALGVAMFGVLQRSHEIQGMRDQGIYTATGIQLARTGALGWTDPLVERHGIDAVEHLFEDVGDFYQGKPRWLRFAGYYVTDPPRGVVWPQFLHGYEVWIALAYSFAGPQATQCVNSLFTALGVLAIFCSLRLVLGARAALLGFVLLILNPAQLWFTRFPSNEMLVQALLWGFILIYCKARSDDGEREAGKENKGDSTLLVLTGILPLAACLLVKFAIWPLLPLAAFELGLRLGGKGLAARTAPIYLGLVGAAGLAFLHAWLFAGFYLYGSWGFTARRFGVSYGFMPILFVGATAAACSFGSMIVSGRGWLARKWDLPAVRGVLISLPLAAVWGAFAWQYLQFASGTHAGDVWSENTNLPEFAQYFTPGLFLVGTAGIALILWRGARPGVGLFMLLLAGAAFFLVRRNIDALHPWAARRWMPVLLPGFCAAIAYPASVMLGRRSRAWRLAGGMLAFVCVLATVFAAPQLLKVRNYRGAIQQVDRWSTHLRADDLVLMQPTALIAQYAPYLKARFDVDAYTQPSTAEDWRATARLAAVVAGEGRQVLFLTDETLTDTATGRHFLSLHAQLPLDYRVLPEGLHRLAHRPIRIDGLVNVYRIDPSQMPDGWFPGWQLPFREREPQAPPVVFDLDYHAQPFIDGFFDPTPLDDGSHYRWTNGTGKFKVGALLNLPVSSGRVRVTAVMNSGREAENRTVDAQWYLDLHDPKRARKIGVSAVAARWGEYTQEIDSALLHPDSVLEIQSLRPRVNDAIPAGRLGVCIRQLRIEPLEDDGAAAGSSPSGSSLQTGRP
jgi:hypothetical protein